MCTRLHLLRHCRRRNGSIVFSRVFRASSYRYHNTQWLLARSSARLRHDTGSRTRPPIGIADAGLEEKSNLALCFDLFRARGANKRFSSYAHAHAAALPWAQVEIPLGVGSLPLVRGGALLPDECHMVILSSNVLAMAQSLEETFRDDFGGEIS